MSGGYKRVNFYELCRLCATNQQKDKTHIFQEEGRKIQLQSKIQSCLSLTVCENDCLPKVVCSKCLRTLEVCYTFRQECVSSERMLSSYFKNFRYTDDFKKSRKVYIKDTTPKSSPPPSQTPEASPVAPIVAAAATSTTPVNTSTFASSPDPKTIVHNQLDHVPFYTVQLPTIVTNQSLEGKGATKNELNSKLLHTSPNQQQQQQQQQNQNQIAFNLNTINLAAIKALPKMGTNEQLNNVVVNANGEVLNITHLVDFESLISQASSLQKINKIAGKPAKKIRDITDEPIIKIDLTNSDVDSEANSNYDTGQTHKYDKLSNNKTTPNKFSYAIKVEDPKVNPSVIFNNLTSEFSQPNANFNAFTSSNNIYTGPSNIITSHSSSNNNNNNNNNGNGNLVPTTSNIVCPQQAVSAEPSTVNLNILTQDLSQPQNFAQARTLQVNNFVSNMITQQQQQNQNKIVTPVTSTSSASEEMPNGQVVKQHVCEICQKSFKRREHLYQHVKLHTGFRPYTCENCNKSFMRKEHLLRHMTSHSGQKNFTCNICDKSFSRNDNLLKHKKTHDKQTSYTCDICQKQFVMKHYYLAHKLTHDGDRCSIGNVWNVLKT